MSKLTSEQGRTASRVAAAKFYSSKKEKNRRGKNSLLNYLCSGESEEKPKGAKGHAQIKRDKKQARVLASVGKKKL